MNASGILTDCLSIEKTNRGNATHFILYSRSKIRYIISLSGGKSRLTKNIKSYSKNLYILMKLMNLLPLQLFQLTKLGYFAKVIPCRAVQRNLRKTKSDHWNVIVGTYDEKQKLVFQCFANGRKTQYVKVGNRNTEGEMRTEIEYLKMDHSDCTFDVPNLVGYEMRSESCPFMIQITDEFYGEKVEPLINEDIINLYKNVCSKDAMFSHGDFAPWNIRKNGEKYILFDWEHCGKRIEGYDIAYFATITGVALEHKSAKHALEDGIVEIQKYIPNFDIDRNDFMREFKKTVKELSESDK